MKLEFKKEFIPEHLFKELDFEGYLDLFSSDLKIILHLILEPLGKSEAEDHFARLYNLEKQISRQSIDLDLLVTQSQELPTIDYLLPFFKDKELEVYHLFDLGRFVIENQKLISQEEHIPLNSQRAICDKIHSKLLKSLTDDFGSLKLNSDEKKLQTAIQETNKSLNIELQKLEHKIFEETGIKMIFPFPKEINKSDERLEKIKSSKNLELKEQEDVFQLEFKLQGHVASLQKKKEELTQQLNSSLSNTLYQLNESLSDCFELFDKYYELRKQRALDYVYLRTAKLHHLHLPRLSTSTTIRMKKGVLPKLRQNEADRYNPLDVQLEKGVNVLFGANMTGKTTVLRTLYFHLILAKFGLPVPAESLEIGFPDHTKLHLRSSGQLKSGLSGFGDELRFFCEMTDNFSIYLIDELFHSTDPANGVKLTKTFLQGLRESNSIFMCTTHYPEVLELTNIKLYKMKDIEKIAPEGDIQSLLENIPYELEPITENDLQNQLTHSNYPLEVALQFPLPEKILNSIRKKLKK